jgi:23S rRNA pseudouridine1911/1915/1917 synthase
MDNPSRTGEAPFVLVENDDFAVVYKPPRIHCVPLKPGEGNTLLEWYADLFPPVMGLRGKKPLEGGILHRLDYETRGLVLFGKNQAALDSLRAQQEGGRFLKEYKALTIAEYIPPPPGFPPPPGLPPAVPFRIASYFRPYGPGRKTVRPVVVGRPGREGAGDRGYPYETEVLEAADPVDGRRCFTLRIKRGFRHQIRCHLAWLGYPIAGDRLYGTGGADGTAPPVSTDELPPPLPDDRLALRAQALYFFDPRGGAPLEFRLPSL